MAATLSKFYSTHHGSRYSIADRADPLLNVKQKMNRILFVALTSGNTAISDGFSEIVSETKDETNFFYFGTKFSVKQWHPRFCDVTYSRNWRALLELMLVGFRLRRFVMANAISDVFFYSTLPINGAMARFLPKSVKVHWWLHDPRPHAGERLLFRVLKNIDDSILRNDGRLAQVFVASNFLRGESEAVGVDARLIRVVPFPYLSALVGEPAKFSQTEPHPALGPRPFRAVFFGRIEAYKGLEWMFEALINEGADLADKVSFHIYGKGHANIPQDRLSDMGFNVEVPNAYIANEELRCELLSADVVIFPYRQATATQAIQSAGALGCRVVLTRVGSLPDAAIAEYADIVSPDDQKAFVQAIRRTVLSRSRSYRKEITEQYRARFSPKRWVDAIVSSVKAPPSDD